MAGHLIKKLGVDTEDLFPTKASPYVFSSYIGLFVAQGLLITASQQSGHSYSYNTVIVVLITECVKLIVALLLYLQERSFVSLVIFSKQLSSKQWLSLVILTAGCIIKQLRPPSRDGDDDQEQNSEETIMNSSNMFHLLLLLVQTLCSCFAGVYNEYLLKDRAPDLHIMLQNTFMYVDSILCNLLIIPLASDLSSTFTAENLAAIFTNPVVIFIVLDNAAIGIVTSLFLRHMNSILKTYASILELFMTALLAWILFGIQINTFTLIALIVVSYAVLLYAQNPVVNKGRIAELAEKRSEQEDV